MEEPSEGALFFHARHVALGWRLTRIGSIDNHIFYRAPAKQNDNKGPKWGLYFVRL